MQINILHISPEGVDFRFSQDGKWFRSLVPQDEENAFSAENIEVSCFARRTFNAITLHGSLSAQITLKCCRCLSIFTIPVTADFNYTFLPAENAPAEAEKELTTDDLECGYYSGDSIDIGQIIAEQIVLQIPLKPLCREACQGLCPVCGINLNQSSCNHQQGPEPSGSPFAVLKKLKIQH